MGFSVLLYKQLLTQMSSVLTVVLAVAIKRTLQTCRPSDVFEAVLLLLLVGDD